MFCSSRWMKCRTQSACHGTYASRSLYKNYISDGKIEVANKPNIHGTNATTFAIQHVNLACCITQKNAAPQGNVIKLRPEPKSRQRAGYQKDSLLFFLYKNEK